MELLTRNIHGVPTFQWWKFKALTKFVIGSEGKYDYAAGFRYMWTFITASSA